MNIKITISLVLFSFSPLYAQEQPKPQQVNSIVQCPSLFGQATQDAENQQTSTNNLNSFEEKEHTINLTYTGRWRKPTRIRLQGIRLVESEPNETAVIRILAQHPSFGCQPGLYRITVNHTLGADTRVLAILKDLVLLLHKDELRYLQVNLFQQPKWRMIWRANWTLQNQEQSTSTSKSSYKRSSRKSYTTPETTPEPRKRYSRSRKSRRR